VKVVFDTNILIAAFLTEGLCSGLLIRARKHDFDLILSDDILREFKGVLTKKIKISSSDISEIIDIINEAASEILHKINFAQRICRDPDDDMIIACAVEAGADYIVTGDQDLLTLKKFKNIIILSPRNFETLFT
jgi:uncharacterized protein